MSETFDYKDNSTKISESFRQKYRQEIHGRETISSEGLTALGHLKGIWKLDVEVLQYPSNQNQMLCICKATIGGYGWDPIEEKICKVEYSDIGDASPNNCSKNIAPAFIRMASTRAIGRALRKYTNLDMVTSDEIGPDNAIVTPYVPITANQLAQVKNLINKKGLTPETFTSLMFSLFNMTDHMALSTEQGDVLIKTLMGMDDKVKQKEAADKDK